MRCVGPRGCAVGMILLVLGSAPTRSARADFTSLFKDKPNIVRQGFPAGKADSLDLTQSDAAWEIEWSITNPNNGAGRASTKPASVLVIRSAKYMFKDGAGKVRWFTV